MNRSTALPTIAAALSVLTLALPAAASADPSTDAFEQITQAVETQNAVSNPSDAFGPLVSDTKTDNVPYAPDPCYPALWIDPR